MDANHIETLKNRLASLYPMASLTMDQPFNSNGNWMLDIIVYGRLFVVSWSALYVSDFGISTITEDTGYGEGPDLVVHSLEEAENHIIKLIDQEFEYE